MKSMTQYLRSFVTYEMCVCEIEPIYRASTCIWACIYLSICSILFVSVSLCIHHHFNLHTHSIYRLLVTCCGWIACQTKIVVPDLSLLNRIYSYSHEFVSFEHIKWMEINKFMCCAHDVRMRRLCKCVCVCMSANQTKLRIHWINYY